MTDSGTSGQPVQAATFNQIHSVRYKRGWPGLFTGENQTKALQRALPELNSSGLKVAAAVKDEWSLIRQLYDLRLRQAW